MTEFEILQWLYILNIIFLMMHETEAVYWKEWQLFGKFGSSLSDTRGLSIFVLARFAILIPALYGLIHLNEFSGLILSLVLSGFLIFHFFIHMVVIFRGSQKFRMPLSYGIQFAILTASIAQLALTIRALI